jgi:hypothetical protein
MKSDKCIDSAWRFMDPEVYNWYSHWNSQQGVMVIPPADGSYAPVTWPLFESAFRYCFVPEVAITPVRIEIRALQYSRRVGEVAHFNKHFSEHIRMLPNETTITCEDRLYDEDCSKLPAGIADQIIASARMQKKLQPATPFMLADAMEMVGEFFEHTTSHPAITATLVNHGANFVPPNTATVPTPVRPEPIDLTVANANTRCYRWTGFGHEVCDGATPQTRRYSQVYRARTGGNCSRRDGGHDRTDTGCGSRGTSARSAAGGINNVQAAAVEDTSVNDDAEDSTVEQEVGDEEYGQGNGNWE